MDSATVEADNVEILKKKIVAFDKLLQHKNKVEARCSDLTRVIGTKDEEIFRLRSELERLQTATDSTSKKLALVEEESRKKSRIIDQLEAKLGERNRDLINKEIEMNKLTRDLEEATNERNISEAQARQDVKVKEEREQYDKEKWKHLATISNLEQLNASLTEAAKVNEEYTQTLIVENQALDKYKLECLNRLKIDAKKDRQILKLTRCLEKANSLLKKSPAEQNEVVAFSPDPGTPSLTSPFPKNFSPGGRFRIISMRGMKRVKRVKFRKMGMLQYCVENALLSRAPTISESRPEFLTDEAEETAEPESPIRTSTNKRKRGGEDHGQGKKKKTEAEYLRSAHVLPENVFSPTINSAHRPTLPNKKPQTPQGDGTSDKKDAETELYFNPNPAKQRFGRVLLASKSETDSSGEDRALPKTSGRSKIPALSPLKEKECVQSATVRVNETKSPASLPPSQTKSAVKAKIFETAFNIETPCALEKKLTPAQLEEAKKRMVGRAPQGVATRPSINGFRASEPAAGAGGKKITGDKSLPKSTDAARPFLKPKLVDVDVATPCRRRTMPSRVCSSGTRPTTDSATVGVGVAGSSSANEQELSAAKVEPASPVLPASGASSITGIRSIPDDPEAAPTAAPGLSGPLDISLQNLAPVESNSTSISEANGDPKTTVNPEDSITNEQKYQNDEHENGELGLCDTSMDNTAEDPRRSSLDSDLDLSEDDDSDGEVTKSTSMQSGRDDNRIAVVDTTPETVQNPMMFKGPDSGLTPDEGKELMSKILNSPSKINLTARKYRNFLEELLSTFSQNQRAKENQVLQKFEELARERKSYAYETYRDVVKTNLKNIMGQQNSKSFENILTSFSSSNTTLNKKVLCDHMYEIFMGEHRFTPLLIEKNLDAPPITRKQQRFFTLLVKLEEQKSFSGVMNNMLDLIYHGFFGRDRMFNMSLSSVLSHGRFFILCARYMDQLDLVKKFLFDLFFFKSPRNHLLVGIVTDLWPEVLQSTSEHLDPMLETLIWMIMHVGDGQKSQEMQVQATRDKITTNYGYRQGDFVSKDLVLKYIRLAESSNDRALLTKLSMCLVMIGRGHDFRWANNHIVSRLLKSLGTATQDKKEQTWLRWVIETIGLVSRLYPAEGRDQVLQLFNPIVDLLKQGSSLESETERCIVNALLLFGYHLQVQVATFLKTWRPVYPLDSLTRKRLEDFVGTRGKKHAQITSHVARLEHERQRKSGMAGSFRGKKPSRGRQ